MFGLAFHVERATCIEAPVERGRPGAHGRLVSIHGIYLIDVRDFEEALEVAAKIPSLPHGTVEVRPCRELEIE